MPSLVDPITLIYSKSLEVGLVPSIWKRTWVTPIPKGTISPDIEKYRPISKLCHFGKILEKIVTNQLSSVARRHIVPNQHGFFSGRSVDTNLLVFSEALLNAIDAKCQVDVVYTDFAKAFDKICHNTLIQKLWRVGIHGDLLRWIKSYIENRSQAVVLGGYISQYEFISSGCHKDPIWGPCCSFCILMTLLKQLIILMC